MAFNTAVLFLIFNRPDTTAQVFEQIRKAKPSRLYIAGDGPRFGRQEDEELVKKAREISTQVDWRCEVKTLFRDANLGCKDAVSSGINWFFEHEREGIIIEDDCLPNQSFFYFCEYLLNKYKKNKNIIMISGYNHYSKRVVGDYYFCKIPGIWGWATWSDRWEKYRVNPELSHNCNLDVGNQDMQVYWSRIFRSNLSDTWDYQLAYMLMSSFGFCIRPTGNLIVNLGFNENATHTTDSSVLLNNEMDNLLFSESLIFSGYKNSFLEELYHFEHRFNFRKNINEENKFIKKIKNALFSR